LPSEYLSHSYRHHDLDPLRARKVVVLGAGSSALDLAGLLQEAGADVSLVARAKTLRFHSAPSGKPRSLWQRLRHPSSGLGPGLRSRFFSDAPGIFYYLPEGLRVETVAKTLGPSGGWFIKDKVVGRVNTLLGCEVVGAKLQGGKVVLDLRAEDGTRREVQADHIIAATGYKVDIERLTFLTPQIRSAVRTVKGSPALSSTFESSVPGLYFVGVAAAISFGPVMRFAFGAGFAAVTVAKAVPRTLPQGRVTDESPAVVGTTK
jgi:cation diffusion facilitator CzcD-associated flavoprotein CzcO